MSPEDSIRKFLSAIATDTRQDLAAKRLNASGKTSDSLTVESQPRAGQLYGLSSIYFIQDKVGRKPGEMPPIESIQEWIKSKGLNLNAWAVAKTIAKKGTKIYRREREGLTINDYAAKYVDELYKDLLDELGIKTVEVLNLFDK